ncbi:MAG: hypothetical protein IJ874_06535 [Ruminococcus sp.]|nr:hypothetical protein [Ruminococcus sp.]
MELDKKAAENAEGNIVVEANEDIRNTAAAAYEVYEQLRAMLAPIERKTGRKLHTALKNDVLELSAFLCAASGGLGYYNAAVINEIFRNEAEKTSVSQLYGLIENMGLAELLPNADKIELPEDLFSDPEIIKSLNSVTGNDSRLLVMLRDMPESTTLSVILYSYSSLLLSVGLLQEATNERPQFLVALNNYLKHQLEKAYSRMDMQTKLRFERSILPQLKDINSDMKQFQ